MSSDFKQGIKERTIKNLLPHSGEMILIHSVLQYDTQSIWTKTHITQDNVFLQNGTFAMYQGIELMAQSLGILRGLLATNQSSKLGFILGIRNFVMYRHTAHIGDTLITKANLSLQDANGFGVYECEIFCEKIRNAQIQDSPVSFHQNLELAAKAKLSILNPNEEFIEQKLYDTEVR
ncbi:hypothetical protein CQA66_00070 [Helicobacter aurati]|uniref:Thioester dehydrase n=1 Tax=Helicobacter aurati TaxID=137778 RepID=A0A3D8J9R1_9HELI|nr:hypothetical protein [Helicobacter aurati]RDU73631.1 hypothetical protein CQA66_00070 [Helicobacter aurati]